MKEVKRPKSYEEALTILRSMCNDCSDALRKLSTRYPDEDAFNKKFSAKIKHLELLCALHAFFGRMVNGRTLVFSTAENGLMTDDRTSSRWDTVTGKCFEGPMKGEALSIIPGMISFRSAWEAFFPEGRLVE